MSYHLTTSYSLSSVDADTQNGQFSDSIQLIMNIFVVHDEKDALLSQTHISKGSRPRCSDSLLTTSYPKYLS